MEASPLKRLPAELRIRIYELALRAPTNIDVLRCSDRRCSHADKSRTWCLTKVPRGLLSFTEACKAVRAESIPVFYGINTFTSPRCYLDFVPLKDWLSKSTDAGYGSAVRSVLILAAWKISLEAQAAAAFSQDYSEMLEDFENPRQLCSSHPHIRFTYKIPTFLPPVKGFYPCGTIPMVLDASDFEGSIKSIPEQARKVDNASDLKMFDHDTIATELDILLGQFHKAAAARVGNDKAGAS